MYREYEPPQTGAVRCVWTSSKVGVQRVVPDGCMDLIWNGERLHVAGPDTQAFLTEANGTTVGVRFQPGAAPGFFDIPAHAIANTRVPLDELWPKVRVHRLVDDLHEGLPGRKLLNAVYSAEPDGFADAVRKLVASNEIRGAADKLGITERHLHRKCLAKFGYGPKTLQRIMRFSSAMELVYAGKPFSDIAYEIGYSDQAHLSREVKALAGATLTKLVRDADLQEASMDDAAVRDATLYDAALHDAALHDAALHDAALRNATLDDAALRDAAIYDGTLTTRHVMTRP
ncbi:AraC family transcriptional regulator [Kibdelosporangium aridum]|uniref:AraC family transcriptional regulator n=1 Tax=Kibdelosporangium aridum TaxID=2030 RepID=A0A428YAD1_KIBAR|nr:DUF6597 domain-containing transcriptional factor [Kibdelosporangium aridum]RSM64596.1 AraC family transcriptional regulator [Kibdelosporangium aridum]